MRPTRSPTAPSAPRLPQLHHEAGHPGGLHPGRARALHAGGRATTGSPRPWRTTRSSTSRRRRRSCGASSRASDHAIRLKAEIMVDHFHEQVHRARTRSAAQARAMVVTNGIDRAIQYFHAIREYLTGAQEPVPGQSSLSPASPSSAVRESDRGVPERLSVRPDRPEDPGGSVPLPRLRGQVPDRLRRAAAAHDVRRQDPVRASRRCRRCRASTGRIPKKHDVFVLDFLNDADTIRDAFADFYRATILADETDPNKLHDLQAEPGRRPGLLAPSRSTSFVASATSAGAERDQLDPILDACVAVYLHRPGRGRPSRVQGQGQGLRADLRLPLIRPPLQRTPTGRSARPSSPS